MKGRVVTIKQLREILDRIEKQYGSKYDDSILAIPVAGLSCDFSHVTSAALGFDWSTGKFVLSTDQLLSRYSQRKVSILKDFWFKKHAKIKRNVDGTFTATYKKLSENFTKEYLANTWVWQNIELDLEKLAK